MNFGDAAVLQAVILLETIRLFFEANTSARKNCRWFRTREDKREELTACEAESRKKKQKKQTAFWTTLVSLRDAPTTFLDAGTRELILLMSPVAERILYPPELKVTSAASPSAWLPELRFPSWGLDSCNNPIKAPSDNKWAAAGLNSRVYMWDKYGLDRHNLEVRLKQERWGTEEEVGGRRGEIH